MKKFLLALIIVIATPALAFAQSKYVPLIDIPLLTQAGDTGFSGYINFLYSLSIGIAGLLAVIKIIVAGVKYMFSDVITDKGSAKKEIQGALFGLLLILGAYIILNTINPQLVTGKPNFKALPDRPDLVTRPSVTVAGQTADQVRADLAAGLDACLVTTTQNGASGNTSVVTANVSSCTANKNPGALLLKFEKACLAKGGAIASGGTGSKILACAIPLDKGREYAGYTLSNYSQIDPAFVKIEANKRTVDITGMCQKKVADSKATAGSIKQNIFNTCVTTTKSTLAEYCTDDNGGNYTSPNICVLPLKRAYLSALKKELEQYKASLPATDYTGKDLTNANNASTEVAKKICAIWGGEFRDIDGSENICVSF